MIFKGKLIQNKSKTANDSNNKCMFVIKKIKGNIFMFNGHNTSTQSLTKINAIINLLVVESLTVNNITGRKNIFSV